MSAGVLILLVIMMLPGAALIALMILAIIGEATAQGKCGYPTPPPPKRRAR